MYVDQSYQDTIQGAENYAAELQLMYAFALISKLLFKVIPRLQDCIVEIWEWLTSNYLK